MSDAKIFLRSGVSEVKMGKVSYVSPWVMNVTLPDDNKRYEFGVLTRGNILSGSGVSARSYWKDGDANTLLRMRVVDSNGSVEPITVEKAEEIQNMLGEVEIEKSKLFVDSSDEVVDFLKPRIVVGAKILRDSDSVVVRLGDIDAKLREEREGREGPHLPLS